MAVTDEQHIKEAWSLVRTAMTHIDQLWDNDLRRDLGAARDSLGTIWDQLDLVLNECWPDR